MVSPSAKHNSPKATLSPSLSRKLFDNKSKESRMTMNTEKNHPPNNKYKSMKEKINSAKRRKESATTNLTGSEHAGTFEDSAGPSSFPCRTADAYDYLAERFPSLS